MVAFDGVEDDFQEVKLAGEAGDAQLEPGPENCAWQVTGSHQAGPVSHCRRGEVRHCCGCP